MVPIYDRDDQFAIEHIDKLKIAGKRRVVYEVEHREEISPRLTTLFKHLEVVDLTSLNVKLKQLGGWCPTGEAVAGEEEIKIFGKVRKIMSVSEHGNVELNPLYKSKVNILSPEFDFLDN